MCDDDGVNALENHLLSVDDPVKDSIVDNNHTSSHVKKHPNSEMSYYIRGSIWSSVSWQLEIARRILNYSTHSLAVFDVTYLIILILEIVVSYDHYYDFHSVGGIPFTIFFVIFMFFNMFAPPLGLHLIRSILLHPSIPRVFQEATKYDPKFHFRMHCLAHFNCAASLLTVLLSFFTNPLYKSIQLPFLVLYVVPLSFTLSVVVCLLEGHRLLACKFIKSIEDGSLYKENCNSSDHHEQEISEEEFSFLNKHTNGNKSLTGVDFYELRNRYYDIHVQFDLTSRLWGKSILFIVIALLLFTVGLVWYSYITNFNSVKFSLVLPYIITSLFALCEVLFSLTLVNELGAKVSKTIAKFIFKYGQNPPVTGSEAIITDINNLLMLTQIVPIEIPFVEGFSLRARLTVVLVGPLIGSIVPKLLEK